MLKYVIAHSLKDGQTVALQRLSCALELHCYIISYQVATKSHK